LPLVPGPPDSQCGSQPPSSGKLTHDPFHVEPLELVAEPPLDVTAPDVVPEDTPPVPPVVLPEIVVPELAFIPAVVPPALLPPLEPPAVPFG
jgi:hypothetical protein